MLKGNEYSPLTLAYIGDAVFELLVRSKIVEETVGPVKSLHKQTSLYVNAQAQAEMYHKISEYLTEEELSVLKRGRNAKSNSRAKSADMIQYRHATGLEALFGYLYINGATERMKELFSCATKEEEV